MSDVKISQNVQKIHIKTELSMIKNDTYSLF